MKTGNNPRYAWAALALALAVGCSRAGSSPSVDASENTGPNTDSGSETESTDTDTDTESPEGCEVAGFSDPNLEGAVREAIGIKDGPISGIQLDTLNKLTADQKGIKDIDGLQCATGLSTLVLSGNEITDLGPLVELGQLKTLSIGDNAIVSLEPLAALSNLDRLYAQGNLIRDISPLEQLPLVDLRLQDNPVEELAPLARVVTLARLYISRIATNDISPLAEIDGLFYLSAEGLGIDDITPLSDLKYLAVLIANDNAISNTGSIGQLCENSNLTRIELGNNKIEDLSPLLNYETSPSELYLTENPLSQHSKDDVAPKLCEDGWFIAWSDGTCGTPSVDD